MRHGGPPTITRPMILSQSMSHPLVIIFIILLPFKPVLVFFWIVLFPVLIPFWVYTFGTFTVGITFTIRTTTPTRFHVTP